jgi:hypothetical protein
VQNPLRRRNRALTVEQREEVQKLVFDLVQTQLVSAFGADGMWTVSMKDRTAIDTFFSKTVAETLAWKIAAQLAEPKKSRHQALAMFSARATKPVPEFTQAEFVESRQLVA